MADKPSCTPVERVRDSHPTDPEWRADALAGSRHSRLLDELRQPLDDFDVDRARQVCGAVTRTLLADLAPALMLLTAERRERAQALATYAATLFDFAAQSGTEGERLAAINRWQFMAEQTFDGDTIGQPAFVLLARQEGHSPWRRDALDELAECARRRATLPRRQTARQLAEERRRLAAALLEAFSEGRPSSQLVGLAAAVLRVAGLQRVGEGLRRQRPPLSRDDLPESDLHSAATLAGAVRRAVKNEYERLRPEFARMPPTPATSRDVRRAARFVFLAARRLLRSMARAPDPIGRPPSLGLAERLLLLARARFSR